MKTDVFISYRTRHAHEVEPLVSALAKAGLEVWRDEARIRHGQSITSSLKEALATTRLLLVYCSDDYHLSDICQWELTTAWLAGLRSTGPYDRILVWMAAENTELARAGLGLASDAKWLVGGMPGSVTWQSALKTIVEKVRALSDEMGPSEVADTSFQP
jgi:hypothetical protein